MTVRERQRKSWWWNGVVWVAVWLGREGRERWWWRWCVGLVLGWLLEGGLGGELAEEGEG